MRARISSGLSGAALVAVARVMPWRALSSRRNSAATVRQLMDPAAPEHQPIRLRTGLLTDLAEDGLAPSPSRDSSGAAGLASIRPTSLVGRDARGRVELGPPRLDRVVTHGHLEGGLGVAAWRPVSSVGAISSSSRPTPAVLRNSSTRRRWRSSVIVSPTTLPAASRARSATSAADVGDRAGLLGLDLRRRPGRAGARAPRGSRRCPRHASPGRPSGRGPGSRSPRGEPRSAWRHARPPRSPDRDGPARRP